MPPNPQPVLVTGGAGYIGSHTCKALASAGYLPVTYDSLVRGFKKLVKWGPLEVGDVCDEARLLDVLVRYKPVGVLHFAGYMIVPESVEKPELYQHNNVTGSKTLLGAMRKAGLRHLVFSSTCAVHGFPKHTPIEESAACAPINPYGQSKLDVERAIHAEAQAHGLNAIILRYFNACGADPAGETGECHEPETHVIPLALEAAAQGKEFHIFGTDYPTKDGSAVRDYIHVSDLAQGHVQALQYMLGTPGCETINLGTGIGTSVHEMVRAIQTVTGTKLNVKISPRRAGDPPELIANVARAKKLLNFSPAHSSIESIVQSAWAWHQRSHTEHS